MTTEGMYGTMPPCVDCDTRDVGCNSGLLDNPAALEQNKSTPVAQRFMSP